jgi:hypothetical protein
MQDHREDYISLKEVLTNNPPLPEESRAIQKAINDNESLSGSSVLTDAQYAAGRSNEVGSTLGSGVEDPHGVNSALKQASHAPAYEDETKPLLGKH